MKLLLRESIRNVGKRGDMIDVSDGYARNYLLPRGLAMQASPENLRKLDAEKRSYDVRQGKEKEKAQEIAAAIAKVQLTVPMRSSEEGHLFGSVTPTTVVDAFKKEGITLEAKMIELENEHIRELGTYSFNIHLHEDVQVQSRVWVVAQKE
ncbi:MAG: 50S ribosomal protein L9 [Planctomycetes bacterium]|nr:50S ribosomal protein L9 [Planctomycetota bacterium]